MPTIKEEMAAIDRRRFNWYLNLTDEERKSLSMWVLMRYCSSTSNRVHEINEHYLTMTNELVNVHFNDLRLHPELQMRLMQCVGIGTDQFHNWIKPGKRSKTAKGNAKLHEFFLGLNPHMNDSEITFLIGSMTEAEIKAMLEDAGTPKDKVKDYFK
jgi:hypothetical protein